MYDDGTKVELNLFRLKITTGSQLKKKWNFLQIMLFWKICLSRMWSQNNIFRFKILSFLIVSILLLWAEARQRILHSHFTTRKSWVVVIWDGIRTTSDSTRWQRSNADESLCLRVTSQRLVISQKCITHVACLPALTTEISKINW